MNPDVVEMARRASVVDADGLLLDHVVRRPDTNVELVPGVPSTTRRYAAPDGRLPPSSPASPLSWLVKQLYIHLYVRPTGRAGPGADSGEAHAFALELTRANGGHGTWDSGWIVESVGSTRHLLSWNGVGFSARPPLVRSGTAPVAPGSPCEVFVPKDRRKLFPGWYFLLGDEAWPSLNAAHTDAIRIYWNVSSSGAPTLVRLLSKQLNDARLPFRCKVVDTPDGYGRADSAVLYLPKDRFDEASDQLLSILRAIAPHLTDQVPMFTKRIAPGVGIAEDPDNGSSFGEHRCQLVARGLWQAHREHLEGWQGRSEAIARVFREEGVDVDRPHLSPGSNQQYRLTLGRRVRPWTRADGRGLSPRQPAEEAPRGTYLDAAARLGELLCNHAYWDSEATRCNWVGRTPDPSATPGVTPQPRASTLGPDLYSGQAGIALFLAELFAHTNVEQFRTTALGALAAAQRQQHLLHGGGAVGTGFFTGTVGIAYAALRVAALTATDSDPTFSSRMADVTDASSHGDDNDVISGRAGTITGLLALERATGRSEHLNGAVRLGQALVASLEQSVILPGMAHGAAGFACALFSLYARTGNRDFLAAGRRALAYEDGLFDPATSTWRDPGGVESQVSATGRPDPATWCNGATGIALARLRAVVADPEESEAYERQARSALDLTRRALRMHTRLGADTSLCHGSGGWIETLLQAGLTLRDPMLVKEAHSSIAAWLTQPARRRYAAEYVRANPGLMLGAAGMGLQLLRMYDPTKVNSILLGP